MRALGLLVVTLGLGATPGSEPPALPMPASIQRLLQTGRWDATPAAFRIVALSYIADGCAAQARTHPSRLAAARSCVDRCLALAEATRARRSLGATDGLWLTHLNLILGARDSLGACPDPARHEEISAELARRSLADPTRHAASYLSVPLRWPADETATLASLGRYDRAHGTRLLEEPLRAWRELVLGRAMDPTLGLPWSEATGKAPGARSPRGCALSWQTRFLHEIDDPLARAWWDRYRRHFLVDHGALVGFREWPVGRERAPDVDSGPIVMGVGAAATGLALPAARAMGDEALALRLETTAALIDAAIGSSPAIAGAAHSVLADSIRFLGAHLQP